MIHKSSIIDPKAQINKNVKIGPFCSIGPNVILDENVELVSNVHIEGNTKIGNGTKIFPFASIGTQPQDLKYKGEKNSLEIGDYNVIREYITINPGTSGGGSKTKIGNNCLVGANTLITEGKEFPDNSLIVGSPGSVKRELTDMEKKIIELSAFHYVENMKKFRDNLKEENIE